MFLFLDVISPIPEIHLINDKKIIVSIQIIQNNHEKLSDTIIPKYLEIQETYKLKDIITHLILTTGPGSYTALRVGASFIAGLSQSMSLPVSIISSENIYEFLNNGNTHSGVYIKSSNSQKFLTFKKNGEFFHKKIESKDTILPQHISNLFCNFINDHSYNKDVNYISFSITRIILENLSNLIFKKNLIIKPKYISNNIILN